MLLPRRIERERRW